MKLYFQRSDGTRKFLKFCRNEKEAMQEIHKFCAERNFKIYYTRYWKEPDGEVWYDVGSHTEFFIIKGIDCVEDVIDEQRNTN